MQNENVTGAINCTNYVCNSNSALTPLVQALMSYDSIIVVQLVVIALVVTGTNQ